MEYNVKRQGLGESEELQELGGLYIALMRAVVYEVKNNPTEESPCFSDDVFIDVKVFNDTVDRISELKNDPQQRDAINKLYDSFVSKTIDHKNAILVLKKEYLILNSISRFNKEFNEYWSEEAIQLRKMIKRRMRAMEKSASFGHDFCLGIKREASRCNAHRYTSN